jgi:hypothetical protein
VRELLKKPALLRNAASPRVFARLAARIVTCASCCGVGVAIAGCKPPVPPPQGAVVAPATLSAFWTGFASTDRAKFDGALRLLLENPQIRSTPFAAQWSMFGSGALGSSSGEWCFADGTRITIEPGGLKQLPAAIDAVVAAKEPDTSKQAALKLELIELVDGVGINLWAAGSAFATPSGGIFGESDLDRVARESALTDIRSYAILLRAVAHDQREKMPAGLVDPAELAKKKDALLRLRREFVSKAPLLGKP